MAYLRSPALLMLAVVLGAAPALAGTPDDPEVRDPQGDVQFADMIPAPHGADWADILSLWFQADDADAVTMHIQVLDAPAVPPSGEIAAFLEIEGQYFLTGFTTVLFPFAIPMYQGGFYCPSTADGIVDPADCDTLPDVSLAENTVTVPLPYDVFHIGPGVVVRTLTAYSAAWYLDVQTRFDESPSGRPFMIERDAAAETAPAPAGGPGDEEQTPAPRAGPPRGAAADAPPAPPLAMVLFLLSLALVRRGIAAARANSKRG